MSKRGPSKKAIPKEIWVALIGLIGAFAVALFSSPLLVSLVQRIPTPTVALSATSTSTSTLRLFSTATQGQILNPTLAVQPTNPQPTVTPGQLRHPICASYFQVPPSPDFVQGIRTDEPAATASLQSCYEWMDIAILHKQNCAQPGATSVTIVLIEQSRHTYNMPKDLNMNTEFVLKQECLP
jgi:hypothetical protein